MLNEHLKVKWRFSLLHVCKCLPLPINTCYAETCLKNTIIKKAEEE